MPSLREHLSPPNDNGNNVSAKPLRIANDIRAMDMVDIQAKLCTDDPFLCRRWTQLEARIGIHLYRNFLYLNYKYANGHPLLVSSLEVDEIWHHHLLDTHKYVRDCQNIFRTCFHHYPYIGTRGDADRQNLLEAFEFTQSLHQREYGYRVPRVWENCRG